MWMSPTRENHDMHIEGLTVRGEDEEWALRGKIRVMYYFPERTRDVITDY